MKGRHEMYKEYSRFYKEYKGVNIYIGAYGYYIIYTSVGQFVADTVHGIKNTINELIRKER